MRRVEVEHWTIMVADRVKAGKPPEDSRVEVKAEWPEPVDAARRIAGHANAAHGDSILWIIGLDEKRHRVTGATANDLANWYPQVKAQFDGIAPDLEDFVVPYDGQRPRGALVRDQRCSVCRPQPNVWKARGRPSQPRNPLA